MILDLVGFISTHFQPKPSHGDPFQAKFWPNCQPYILIRTRFLGILMIWTWFSGFLMILTNPKRCGTSVRSFSTHFRAEISVMCQKTKVSVLWKRCFFSLKPRVWPLDIPAGAPPLPPKKNDFVLKTRDWPLDIPAGAFFCPKSDFYLKRRDWPLDIPAGAFPPHPPSQKRLLFKN